MHNSIEKIKVCGQRLTRAAAILAVAWSACAGGAQAGVLRPTLATFELASNRWSPVSAGARQTNGQGLLFKINYVNKDETAAPAGDLYFAVPSDVLLTSVDDAVNANYSVDGGHSFGPLNRLIVDRGDGRVQAQLADVTHVRWRLSHRVGPGEGGSLTAHAVRP